LQKIWSTMICWHRECCTQVSSIALFTP
jgi:hypothetical protein